MSSFAILLLVIILTDRAPFVVSLAELGSGSSNGDALNLSKQALRAGLF